ncbi:MAG: MFS transporter [Planctomycetota bacterium]
MESRPPRGHRLAVVVDRSEDPAPRLPGQGEARRATVVISLAVLCASSTWFAGAAAGDEIARGLGHGASAAAWFTTITQVGFVVGTLVFAVLNLADRFPPRRVFALSALLGAGTTLGFANASSLPLALGLRFLTGFAMAGVYPVGMRLVAAWSPRGLGLRLSVLVGALSLGTAFPFAIRAILESSENRASAVGSTAVVVASAAGVLGALIVFLAAEGPRLRARAVFDPKQVWAPFRSRAFRRNAFGYFGHMVELYAFWGLLPLWLRSARPDWIEADVQMVAAVVVGCGAIGCLLGGVIQQRIDFERTEPISRGSLAVARGALVVSGACCLCSPGLARLPDSLMLPLLGLWGLAVLADSPQFSTLAAQTCPAEYTGTALTVQNGAGFLCTVLSIQGLAALSGAIEPTLAFSFLAVGPLFGLLALRSGFSAESD